MLFRMMTTKWNLFAQIHVLSNQSATGKQHQGITGRNEELSVWNTLHSVENIYGVTITLRGQSAAALRIRSSLGTLKICAQMFIELVNAPHAAHVQRQSTPNHGFSSQYHPVFDAHLVNSICTLRAQLHVPIPMRMLQLAGIIAVHVTLKSICPFPFPRLDAIIF